MQWHPNGLVLSELLLCKIIQGLKFVKFKGLDGEKMKISVKKGEILSINRTLDGLADGGIRFKYFVSRNKGLLSGEVESINAAIESKIPKFKEYLDARTEILKESIEFDDKGQPVTIHGNYQIKKEKADEFKSKMVGLEAEYKDTLTERSKEIEEHNKFLSEQVEIEVYQVQLNDVPDSLSQRDFDILCQLIVE